MVLRQSLAAGSKYWMTTVYDSAINIAVEIEVALVLKKSIS